MVRLLLVVKGMRFPIEVILVCIRWYAVYPLSCLEEMMEDRGVSVDHSTVSRWATRFLALMEKIFRKYKHLVAGSWRMDETYIKVKSTWKGSVAKNKKWLYLIFQLAVFKHLLNSLMSKIIFCNRARLIIWRQKK